MDEDDNMYMQNMDEGIDLEYPSLEELSSGYSSNDIPRPRFPDFPAEKNVHDPQLMIAQKYSSTEDFR